MNAFAQFRLNLKYAFRLHKPLLTARLARAVIESSVLKRPRLRYVDFAIDFKCNLKCAHCFATALKQEGRRRLGIDDYRGIARQSMSLGAVNFSFQGGEPLLFDNLADIINVFKPDRNVISVTTNGTLLNESRVKELRKTGVDILTVSLDSGDAEEHDKFRGMPGCFDKTLAGIKIALRKGLRVTIGCVVTHKTVKTKGILDLIRIAVNLKTLLYIILPVRAGRWSDDADIALTADDLEYIDSLTRRTPYVRTDFQANIGGYGCGAIKEILYITPYGDVLPCPFLHVAIGNAFNESIASIREKGLRNPYFSTYHDKCLASTDFEFAERYLSKTFTAKQLPLGWHEVFEGRQRK